MTAKISISVPDDVAEWLAARPNVSAAVTSALRAQMHATRTDQVLRAAGFDITEDGKRRWRERLSRPIPQDALTEARRMLAPPQDTAA